MKPKQILNFCALCFVLIFTTPITSLAVESNWGSYQIKEGQTKDLTMDAVVMGTTRLSTVTVTSWRWYSNNSSVVKIKSSVLYGCTIEGVSEGTTRVYCELKYNVNASYTAIPYNIEGYFTIKVEASKICVESIELNEKSVSLDINNDKTKQLSVKSILPSNATDKSVSWSSSNSNIVSVSNSGLLTAKSVGNAIITCKANDNCGVKTTCTVDVGPIIPVKDIEISPSPISLYVGQKQQLSKAVKPDNATNKSVRWKSNNLSVADVSSDGLVEAKAKGTTFIICEATDGSNVKGTCEVTVKNIPVEEIRLDPKSKTLEKGKTITIKATVLPNNATDRSITWKSDHANIASVNSDGLVTANQKGEAIITCTANDGSGVIATCKIKVGSLEIDITNFPDENFRKFLLSQDYGMDGELTTDEISKITSITLPGTYSSPGNISSLKGVEFFTALKSLSCNYNNLVTLDISKNTALTYLSCWSNKLTSLDVSKHKALEYLDCDDNQLTSLDVSKNTALRNLYCYKNQLAILDITNNTALNYLRCGNNQLTTLDISKNTLLKSLSCDNNKLTTLDISKNTLLESLSCDNNKLTSLEVSKHKALEYLDCDDNQLTSLDVSKNTAIEYLYCDDNQLTTLDVSKNTGLKSLSCSSNQLMVLDISNNTGLTSLSCSSNQLMALDISNNTGLTSLSCSNNQLMVLDISNNTILESLYCSNNQLTILNVSKHSALKKFYCDNNLLTDLDVSKNMTLTDLYCGNNQLSVLNVSRNLSLSFLSCGKNKLTSLDVSKNIALTYLSCYGNQLTALDVSKNTGLTSLSCYGNQLTALDVSKNTALTYLSCSDNQLTALDVSKNTALSTIYCSINKIKGNAMDALVNSLPKNSADNKKFHVLNNIGGKEGNDCTMEQAIKAKEKGWSPLYYNGTEWQEITIKYDVMTSSAGYATFYDSQSAYTLPNGLSAQVVTGVSNNKLTYKTIADGSVSGIVPKATAVMLVNDSKRSSTFTLTPSTSTTSYSGTNLLRGSNQATTTTGDGYHYKLSYGKSGSSMSNIFGWYWGAQNGGAFQIEGHKAWLVLPKSAGARAFSIDGEVTDIETIDNERLADDNWFDLQGRRISKPTEKGVYICNGKKVMIK